MTDDPTRRTEILSRKIPDAPPHERLQLFLSAWRAAALIDDEDRRRIERIEIANRLKTLPEVDHGAAVREVLPVVETEHGFHAARLLGRLVDVATGRELDDVVRAASEVAPEHGEAELLAAALPRVREDERPSLVQQALPALQTSARVPSLRGDSSRVAVSLRLLPYTRSDERERLYRDTLRATELESRSFQPIALAHLAAFAPIGERRSILLDALVACQYLSEWSWDGERAIDLLRQRLDSLPVDERSMVLNNAMAALAPLEDEGRRMRGLRVLSELEPSLVMPTEPRQSTPSAPESPGEAPAQTVAELLDRLAATETEREKARTAVEDGRAKLRSLRDRR